MVYSSLSSTVSSAVANDYSVFVRKHLITTSTGYEKGSSDPTSLSLFKKLKSARKNVKSLSLEKYILASNLEF